MVGGFDAGVDFSFELWLLLIGLIVGDVGHYLTVIDSHGSDNL